MEDMGPIEAVRMRGLVEFLNFLRRVGAREMGFLGPHMIRDMLELLLPFQVLDMAADSFLAGLVSILDPPDTWVPSHLDLWPGE